MVDKFQPMAVIVKLDEMRKQVKEASDKPNLLPIEKKRFQAMITTLVWAKAEVMTLATSKERFVD